MQRRALPRMRAAEDFPILLAWAQEMYATERPVNTVVTYVSTLGRLTKAACLPCPTLLSKLDIITYFAARTELKKSSKFAYLMMVRAFFTWADKPDPGAKINLGKRDRRKPQPALSETDTAGLLQHLKPRRKTRAYVLCGAYLGLRSAETAAIQCEDIFHKDGRPHLRIRSEDTKSGREDDVPIPPIVWAELSYWIAQRGARGPLWTANAHTIRQCIRDAGVTILGHGIGSHELRRRFGTAVYTETRDLVLTSRMLRHSDTAMTLRYIDIADTEVYADVADRLPGASGT